MFQNKTKKKKKKKTLNRLKDKQYQNKDALFVTALHYKKKKKKKKKDHK